MSDTKKKIEDTDLTVDRLESDRLIWLCTSFSIFKEKSAEELAEDGPKAGNEDAEDYTLEELDDE